MAESPTRRGEYVEHIEHKQSGVIDCGPIDGFVYVCWLLESTEITQMEYYMDHVSITQIRELTNVPGPFLKELRLKVMG